ncbi:hypothetical protein [Paenibacillus sp. DMB5]|uniref:hypothetical protein n=1 Tax=Paenibacillus sp. DMB5 TaxID=1780103 RepID=UPI00076BE5CE|nr:hypothetical protein [Paenibacillus sp. DMB5]KUP24639.1 hypothetical protein AWJ19_20205 [Paenibacillus sp. DMB5]
MRKDNKTFITGLCAALLLVLTGCTAAYQAPKTAPIHSMTELGGNLDPLDRTVSPVIQDVYDRSIPAEVYSAD